MTDVLAVFHSRSGHCRMVAGALSRKHGWALGEVAYLSGPQSYFRCARDALLLREPEIRYTGLEPSRFDVVVLVSPTWFWRLCPPMRRFIRSMGGRGASNAVAEVEHLVHRPVVAQLALLQADIEAGREVEPLRAFAEQVAARAAGRARPNSAFVAAQAA